MVLVFNEFNLNEFNDEIFIVRLKEYVNQNRDKEVSENTLKDYLCLKNTYLFENSRGDARDMEEIISSPLRELKLITNLGNRKRYLKTREI